MKVQPDHGTCSVKLWLRRLFCSGGPKDEPNRRSLNEEQLRTSARAMTDLVYIILTLQYGEN